MNDVIEQRIVEHEQQGEQRAAYGSGCGFTGEGLERGVRQGLCHYQPQPDAPVLHGVLAANWSVSV